MSLLNSATLANSKTPYYALASEGASNWYKFPSQNGEILLTDALSTQVLQSIDGNLYYNNELLAAASSLQDIADWSLYPAISTLEMNGQAITQLSTLQVSSVTAVQINALGVSASVISGTTVATVPGPYNPMDVKTATVTASGTVTAGSVSAGSVVSPAISTQSISTTTVTASGAIQGVGIATTAGINMTNTALSNATAVTLNSGGMAPYGSLTSPDGVMLTWNGLPITTGGGGSAASWSLYNQLSSLSSLTAVQILGNNASVSSFVAGSGNVSSMYVSSLTTETFTTSNLSLNTLTVNSTLTANGNIVMAAGNINGAGTINAISGNFTNPITGAAVLTVGGPSIVGLPGILQVNGVANVTTAVNAAQFIGGGITCSGDATFESGGFNACYVTGGFTQTPGKNNFIHGAHLGAANVTVEVENVEISFDFCRIDVLPIGIDIVSPTYITQEAAGAANIAAGGAISLAAGGYVGLESASGLVYLSGTGNDICDLVFENGGSVTNIGGIQGQGQRRRGSRKHQLSQWMVQPSNEQRCISLSDFTNQRPARPRSI